MEQNVKPLHTLADKVKLASDPSPTSNLQKSARKCERDVNKVLIVSGKHKFKDSVETKKAFVKVLPMKKLVLAFNTARGNIHLEFLSSEEAREILNSWRPNYFGTKTTIRQTGERSDRRSAVIKGVLTGLQIEKMRSELEIPFLGVQAKRFMKADSTVLQTVKLTFQCETHFLKAIDERLFLECLYFQPTDFVQKGIRIVCCYNCQKFGNLSANCHSKTTCKHCSEEHKFEECSKTETDSKCAICKGNHEADSIECLKYRKQQQIVYENRGLASPGQQNYGL